MPVLSFEEKIKQWFAAKEYQAPLVLVGMWAEISERVLQILSPKDKYISETENRSIAIKEIREVLGAITTTTPFGSRLIVIPDCERLSLPAAQALLKALEEPNAGNRWLLTTKYPRRLLPTIRSRVQIVRTAGNTPGVAATPGVKEAVQIDFAARLSQKARLPLDEEELSAINAFIQKKLWESQNQPALFRALLRLRDFYKIKSLGGNEKLAGDVLLASLVELESRR